MAHYHLGNYEQAYKYFKKASLQPDIENRSLYNLAVTSFKLKNIAETQELLLALSHNLKSDDFDPVCDYEIGTIYAALGQYDEARKLTIELGIDIIDLAEWPTLAYSIFKTDPRLFDENISKSISEKADWIDELENNHEDWEDYSEAEKIEKIEELREEIAAKRNMRVNFEKHKPTAELTIINENCEYLLFGCEQHSNPYDDC